MEPSGTVEDDADFVLGGMVLAGDAADVADNAFGCRWALLAPGLAVVLAPKFLFSCSEQQ